MKPKPKPAVTPSTKAEWCAYRCQLSCKIGRDAIEGKTKPPGGCTPMEYAIFNLLHAVEELSKVTALLGQKLPKNPLTAPAGVVD